jgi:hypothetical protein
MEHFDFGSDLLQKVESNAPKPNMVGTLFIPCADAMDENEKSIR